MNTDVKSKCFELIGVHRCPIGGCLALLLLLGAAPATQPTPVPDNPGVVVYKNLAYGPETTRANLLDLYLPEKRDGKKLPVLLWIHGGGWLGGGKEAVPGVIFVDKGYAAVSINYRFSSEKIFPAQIHDCKAAIRWLRAHADEYGLDKDRIGVWGASAGGHLAALLGTSGGVKELEGDVGGNLEQSSNVQCVIDIFGPAWLPTAEDELKQQFPGEKLASPAMMHALVGGPDKTEAMIAASPQRYIDQSDPPFLILQGGKDILVPKVQSENFAAALKKAGVETELVIFPNAGHGGPEFGSKETLMKCYTFFEKHLKAR